MFANTPPDPDLVQPTIVVRGVRQQSQWEMDLIRCSLQLNFAADQFQFVNGSGGGGAGSTTNTYPWATAEDILEMAQIVVESPPTWTGSNTSLSSYARPSFGTTMGTVHGTRYNRGSTIELEADSLDDALRQFTDDYSLF